MIDDQVVITVERLRDELAELREALHARYRDSTRQVTAEDLRQHAASIAETWMVELGVREDIRGEVSSDYLADLNVLFQRLLSYSEHASQRKRYDSVLDPILKRFTLELVIPLKQARGQAQSSARKVEFATTSRIVAQAEAQADAPFMQKAFLGHSFLPNDKRVVNCVNQILTAIGIVVVTGEKPRADKISEKVKRLIEDQTIFVGVFTRRDKIARKNEWTTSPWVVDEKAYAVGKGRKLILIKEEGVGSIGGIQGDYEFIEFNRDRLEELTVKLVQLFEIIVAGLR